MKLVLAFGLLAFTGCVRATEGMVREQAAAAFSCADYALRVEEVGPDVYRAEGCGQEQIYACQPALRRGPAGEPGPGAGDEVADRGDDPAMVCSRRTW